MLQHLQAISVVATMHTITPAEAQRGDHVLLAFPEIPVWRYQEILPLVHFPLRKRRDANKAGPLQKFSTQHTTWSVLDRTGESGQDGQDRALSRKC